MRVVLPDRAGQVNELGVYSVLTDADLGERLRRERANAGISLPQMAGAIHYSKSLLSLVETGKRKPTDAIVTAYEQILGVDMWRRDITHPDLLTVNKTSRTKLIADVEKGDPGPLKTRPTAHRTDVALGNHVSDAAAEWFRKWMVEGETATLRTNSLSVIAKLPGKQNSDLVIKVLESDPKVRRLILASEISRLTQLDWDTAKKAADDPTIIPNPRKIATKLSKGAINPRGTESRWCCAYLLNKLVPVLGQ
jgi:transcriptional regulator with XRE-family HTH domain